MLRNIVSRALPLARIGKPAFATTPSINHMATRAFATKAKRDPVQFFDTNGKYGHALFNIATENKCVEQVESDLVTFLDMVEQSDSFAKFLADPTVTAVNKSQAISKLFEKTDFQPLTKEFFNLLARNSRLAEFPKVFKAYFDILCDARGEVFGKVVSAEPLSAAQLAAVEKSLSSHIDSDQKLVLSQAVDPALLGGIQISVGNKYADLSIATRIKKASEVLMKAGQSY